MTLYLRMISGREAGAPFIWQKLLKQITILAIVLLVIQVNVNGQPVVNNAENYGIGTFLKSKLCDPTGVSAGGSGANQTWDFSTLTGASDTHTIDMVSPSSTAFGDSFPQATIAEIHSDNRQVFYYKTDSANYLVGLVDSNLNLYMKHIDPAQYVFRPMSFNENRQDSFFVRFKASGQTIYGYGILDIRADGYGKLILPNGTFDNVLRVRYVQSQKDSIAGFGVIGTTTVTTFTWFGENSTAPLLRISSINSTSGFNMKQVIYLLSENISVPETSKAPYLEFYPNPAGSHFAVKTREKGVLTVSNSLGQALLTRPIHSGTTTLQTGEFSSGIYLLSFQTEGGISSAKLFVE